MCSYISREKTLTLSLNSLKMYNQVPELKLELLNEN